MRSVYVVSDNIFSPLGKTTTENFAKLKSGISSVEKHIDASKSSQEFYASIFPDEIDLPEEIDQHYTKFERLIISSIKAALKSGKVDLRDPRTVLIISSTKGNISLLENENISPALKKRISLSSSARIVADYFQYKSQPIVVSNACISSLVAMLIAKRMIQSGQYDHAVVAGADVISKFILSGFESFQAVSSSRCKPFDIDRNGINLGEAAATILLSSDKKLSQSGIAITGGSISNDANHISGPSMTGEELNIAIQKALMEANVNSNDIDFISAHGTATVYNDEMEAKAISLAGLASVPVNSLKGYYGHTLGAAGLLESIISLQSMKESVLIPSLGLNQIGVSVPLNVTRSVQNKKITNCLKTASGFGGCNAALIFGSS